MTLVTDSSGWSQKEGAGDHGAYEGESEKEKWVSREVFPVSSSNGVLMGGWSEFFGRKGRHLFSEIVTNLLTALKGWKVLFPK